MQSHQKESSQEWMHLRRMQKLEDERNAREEARQNLERARREREAADRERLAKRAEQERERKIKLVSRQKMRQSERDADSQVMQRPAPPGLPSHPRPRATPWSQTNVHHEP